MQPLGTVQSLPSSLASSSCSSWIGSFRIPEKFLTVTMKVLSEEMITDKARVEIVAAIALQAYQHSTYPTSEEYTTMCTKLIERYPFLKDKVGNGIVSSGATDA